MKLLFLIGEIFKIKTDPSKDLVFKKFHYGPWAENFDILINPLILGDVISFSEDMNIKNYVLSQKKLVKIQDFIGKNYSTMSEYQDEIKLIQFLTEHFPQQNLNELIQFVYFLKPDFAEISEIKEEIKKINPRFNQNLILSFIKNSPKFYLPFLFNVECIDGVFYTFKIKKETPDYDLLKSFIEKIVFFIQSPKQFNKNEIIDILNQFCKLDHNRTYLFLKNGLLAIFLIFNFDWIEAFYRQLLLFIFKSLMLKWPLQDKANFHKLNQFLIEFKKETGLKSFFKELPKLDEDELVNSIYYSLRDSGSQKGAIKNSSMDEIEEDIALQKDIEIFFFDDEEDLDSDEEENKELEESFTVPNQN